MSEVPQKKIVYLTAGAGGMFCGSCMNDNTLAKALAKDVDIQLVPTYTPIRTDEEDTSVDQIFFGGINVYLQQKIPFFRLIPKLMDRFLDNPWLIRRVASRAVNMKPEELGKLSVSMLKGSGGFQRKEVKRLCNWLREKAKPDLLMLTNILIGGCIPDVRQEMGIPIIVMLQGDDIFLESLTPAHRKKAIHEIQRLQEHVTLFVAHSQYYADFMSDYLTIPREKIRVVPLGLDLGDFKNFQVEEDLNDSGEPENESQGVASSSSPSDCTVGYLARFAPEKGLHLLVDAFVELKKNPQFSETRLKIAGWLGEHNRPYLNEQLEKIEAAGLIDSFENLGSVDRAGKIEFLKSIDLLAVPTTYREPKGIFALEAMAARVPVLVPAHGAFPEILHDTQGGIMSEPDSVSDTVSKLEEMLSDKELRADRAANGHAAIFENRNSIRMAERFLDIFNELLDKPE